MVLVIGCTGLVEGREWLAGWLYHAVFSLGGWFRAPVCWVAGWPLPLPSRFGWSGVGLHGLFFTIQWSSFAGWLGGLEEDRRPLLTRPLQLARLFEGFAASVGGVVGLSAVAALVCCWVPRHGSRTPHSSVLRRDGGTSQVRRGMCAESHGPSRPPEVDDSTQSVPEETDGPGPGHSTCRSAARNS